MWGYRDSITKRVMDELDTSAPGLTYRVAAVLDHEASLVKGWVYDLTCTAVWDCNGYLNRGHECTLCGWTTRAQIRGFSQTVWDDLDKRAMGGEDPVSYVTSTAPGRAQETYLASWVLKDNLADAHDQILNEERALVASVSEEVLGARNREDLTRWLRSHAGDDPELVAALQRLDSGTLFA